MELSWTRRDMFLVLEKHLDESYKEKVKFLIDKLAGKSAETFEIAPESAITLKSVFQKMLQKWKKVNRTRRDFENKFKDWLDTSTTLSVNYTVPLIPS